MYFYIKNKDIIKIGREGASLACDSVAMRFADQKEYKHKSQTSSEKPLDL